MAAAELRIICGPTAAGKSAIGLRLAEHHDAAIIAADSRQVYRRFDIGTAKPTSAERRRVRHFGVDLVEPTERYSAARWARDAAAALAALGSRQRAVIVGGTGLYLRALTNPLFEEPAMDADQRAALAHELEMLSLTALRRWCERVDPARAGLGRTQLLRSIEIATLTGERLSDLHRRTDSAATIPARYLVVDPGRSLADRIERRVDAMLSSGWPDEVSALLRDVPPDAPAWKASGYATVRSLVMGRLDLSSARERIIIETRQYAKRQRTWFRNQLDPDSVTMLSPDAADVDDVVDRWWTGEGKIAS